MSRYGGGRRDRYQGRQNLNAEAWCSKHQRYFRTHMQMGALHDHPWVNLSVLLHGSYTEYRILEGGIHTQTLRRPGAVVARMPGTAHRIELPPGKTCITLFVTGPKVRDWGFHCPRGWVPWQIFTKPGNSGAIGAGCGDTNEGLKA